MPTLPPGYRLIALETIDSTNEEAKRSGQGADRTVIWAKQQTAGRGRRGRSWMSLPGNLFASIVVKPDCPIAEAAQLSFVAALAVADVLADIGLNDRITLKWPNDVLVDGAKISGILLEATSSGAEIDTVIIGIGINLAGHPDDTPYPATDALAAAGETARPDTVLERLIAAFDQRYGTWKARGFDVTRQDWLDRAHGRGGPIRVQLDSEALDGRFADLDRSGALVVELPDGSIRNVTAGDVNFPKED